MPLMIWTVSFVMPPRFGFVDAFAVAPLLLLPSNGFLKEGKEPKATKPCITRLREEEEEEGEEDEEDEEEDGFDLLRAAGSEEERKEADKVIIMDKKNEEKSCALFLQICARAITTLLEY